jgi:5-methylthioadenosine/S-adenosylhomocysteine deaminase
MRSEHRSGSVANARSAIGSGVSVTSLLIVDGHVLDLALPFAQADVLIEDGRIARVGPGSRHADRIVDASGQVVMPGLIDAHTHGAQALDRGLGDRLTLDQWGVFAALGGVALDARESYALTAWNALTLLRSGCTAAMDVTAPSAIFGDGFDAVMQAYVDTGLRASVALALVDMDFYDTLPRSLLRGVALPRMPFARPPAAAQLAAARRALAGWSGRHPTLQPCLGPSAPQRLTDELLSGCFDLSAEFDAGVHTHVLETRSHWFACRDRFGCSPVEYLHAKGWLGPRLSLAHGVWLSEDDMSRLAETGTPLAHNPVSNLRLASGIADLQRLVAAGVTVGIGTDGAASNDGQNMWEAIKLTALLHRVYGKRERWVTAADALRLCLEGGAAILRRKIGAIRPGYEADLILLGGRDVFLRPKDQMIASLVLGELGASVRTAIVGGEVVLDDGRATRIDESGLRSEVARIVERSAAGDVARSQAYTESAALLERMLAAVEAAEDGPPGIVFPGR